MNKIIKYFDLASDLRPKGATGKAAGKQLHWFPQYIALVLGVLIQPFFTFYQQTGNWNFGGFSGRVLFALIVGIIVFPAIYKNAFDPDKPIFVQLCAIFAAGMGWESMLRTVLKTVGG